jgi:hypothetical protein
MTEQVFETKVINHTSEMYPVYESNGELLVQISSKGWITVTSQSALTTYARWSQVDLFKDHVELQERSGWEEPVRGQFEIELLNVDGGELEQRAVGGSIVFLPRHIPVRVGIAINDPLIWYSRITIQRIWERRKDEHFPGYYVRIPVTKDVRTERPETESFWILGAMEDQNIEPPERELAAKEERAEFETIFENKTDQPVKVFADTGVPFFLVGAKRSVILESYDAKAMYARYKKLTFKKDGKVDLDENKRWENPYPLSIELKNEDGCPTESVMLNGIHINIIRGIPRFAEVQLDEEAVLYKSFTWKKIKIKKERPSLPNYFEEIEEVHLVKELRSEKEVKGLRLQRAGFIDKKAEAEKAKIMKGGN